MRAALRQTVRGLDQVPVALAIAGMVVIVLALALAQALVWLVRALVDTSPSVLLGRGYRDRPFRGPFVTIHASPPKGPRAYDWADTTDGQNAP